MRISQLTLTNFRNYSKRTFSFDPELTLAVGPNGSGKTNILEAIYLLATGESWRGETSEEMIQFDKDAAHISAVIPENSEYSDSRTIRTSESQKARKSDTLTSGNSDSSGSQSFPSVPKPTELHIILSRGIVQGKRVAKMKYMVDGVPKRKSDFVGRLKVVLFEPQSLMIVIGDPSYRRGFLDEALSQTDAEYRNDLHVYTRALKVRNRLLDAIREGKVHREQLEFWERAMVKHGRKLQESRAHFIDWINQLLASKGDSFKGVSFFRLLYEPSVMSEARLEQYREREIAAGFSLIGPQRDDFKLQVTSDKLQARQRDLASFGSRGEQRMAVFKLKLAEAQWIEEKTGESPVLLLDDIYSELDDEHDRMVSELVRDRQTIITATEIPGDFTDVGNVIKLYL